MLGASPRTLQRSLAATSRTFAAVRCDVRRERALTLLEQSDQKVEAIARAIGFASTGHFSAWFRRHQGVTPSQFRANIERNVVEASVRPDEAGRGGQSSS